ncbi:acetylxylan esterase [Streptomyces sp. NPDC020996]|uniref:acetylxylan esterase n=1 Tax=Streptomyces sp. NPDC020996 TaxID=3154791 RepID=UPI0033F6D0EE
MPLTDIPLDDLLTYRAAHSAPEDFDSFWKDTLEQARAQDSAPRVTPVHDSCSPRWTCTTCASPAGTASPSPPG